MVVAIIDVDHFQAINNNYGHSIGDIALKQISIVIHRIVENGTTIKYGKDEFLLIFNNISKEEFYDTLDKIKTSIEIIII